MNTDRMRVYSRHFISTFFSKFTEFFSQNSDFILDILFRFFSQNLTSLISHYNDFYLEMVLFFYYYLALILSRI